MQDEARDMDDGQDAADTAAEFASTTQSMERLMVSIYEAALFRFLRK